MSCGVRLMGIEKKSNALTKEWDSFMQEQNSSFSRRQAYKFRNKVERKYFGNRGATPSY